MPNPVFPTLTNTEDSSFYNLELEDSSMKTEMEGGYVVTRSKHTRAARRTFTSGFTFLNTADKALLDTFYGSTVKGGAVIFDWTDPVTTTVYQVRFLEPMSFKYVGKGTNKLWNVTFKLQQA